MNTNTPQEMLAIIQAHLDGKPLQYWSQVTGLPKEGTWADVVGKPLFAFHNTVYRVKPMPKKVPLAQSDIPLDRPVWIQQGLTYDMVVGTESRGLRTRDSWIPFENLARCSYYISFDGGKTWQKCEKEVAE